MKHVDETGAYVEAQSEAARKPDKGTREIYLIRHGTTKLNNEDASVDRIRGWKPVPLSEKGRKEAHQVAKSIGQKKNPPTVLLASDLERAAETAEIVAKYNDIPMAKPTKDFRPWNVGEFAGQKSIEALPHMLKYVDEPDKVVPGGESFNTFRNRLFGGLAKALRDHDGLIGIVSHHRVERLLKSWAKGGYRPDGEIDKAEFSKRGEGTGHCELISIPVKRLQEFDE